MSLAVKLVTSLEEAGDARLSRDFLNQQDAVFVQLSVNSGEDLLQVLPGKVMHSPLDDDLVIVNVPCNKRLRRLTKSLNIGYGCTELN